MLKANDIKERRKNRQRFKLKAVANGRPRLSIHRTSKHMYAQIIDDEKSVTVAAASTLSKDAKGSYKNGANKDAAALVGKLIAQEAKKAGVEKVIFDRSGLAFHGRVKALADAARENGLEF